MDRTALINETTSAVYSRFPAPDYSISASAQRAKVSVTTTGLRNGSLAIIGGGKIRGTIIQRFLELAGGPGISIGILPTVVGADDSDQNAGGADEFGNAGAANLIVLHTEDREVANGQSS